jgi:hypothetical protein
MSNPSAVEVTFEEIFVVKSYADYTRPEGIATKWRDNDGRGMK